MVKRKMLLNVEAIDSEELEEDDGIIDGELDEKKYGKPLVSFKFDGLERLSTEPLLKKEHAVNIKTDTAAILKDNRQLKTTANGFTPCIDGEAFDISRTYKVRKSTAKMLNELKGAHPNVNVYMNTIVDSAVRYYYNYILHEKGVQK